MIKKFAKANLPIRKKKEIKKISKFILNFFLMRNNFLNTFFKIVYQQFIYNNYFLTFKI
jgi:hypothetical protein